MKVMLTVDYWDGTLSKSKIVEFEDIDTRTLTFAMLHSGVAGMTITHIDKLPKIIKHLKSGNDKD